MRVHELAKELNLESKSLIAVLNKINIQVKSHASSISNDDIKKIKEHLNNLTNKQSKENKKAEKQKKIIIKKEEEIKKEEVKETTEKEEEKLTIIEIEEEELTVKDFAEKINKPLAALIKLMLQKGVMLNLNQNIDMDLASDIAAEFDILLDKKEKKQENHKQRVENMFIDELEEDGRFLKHRPPIVTIMGHVDHGKTKILDMIRNANVVDKEAGGITQHIGAYQVTVHGKLITFIDTPGHEAFTEIRARGAQLTDLVILVVAADDGVMPQTIEAINHAKSAEVPIIVAVNKIDKPDSNPEKVKQQLVEYDLVSEDWGGKTIMTNVSAKDGTGIDELLEMVLLTSEMEELKANPHKKATGIIIESKLSKSRGAIATVLIKGGTLRIGDPLVIGPVYGKVRAIINDTGKKKKEAKPSEPVEIMGLSTVPKVGDVLQVVSTEKEAKKIAEERSHEITDITHQKKKAMTLEEVAIKINKGETNKLNIIVKADVIGSLEAIIASLEKKVKIENSSINIVHKGTGDITQSDVMLALASNAIILGFNIASPVSIKNKAEDEGVDIRLYSIIYKLLEDIEDTLTGLMKPEYKKVLSGVAEIRNLFQSSKLGTIAGCYVTQGKLTRNSVIEVIRKDNLLFDGKLDSLKRFKEDVKEVNSGYECGIVLEGFNSFVEGDEIKVFDLKEVKK